MQFNYRFLSVAALVLSISFTACKKDDSKQSSGGDNTTEVQAQADDQSMVSDDMDDVANDVSVAVEGSGTFTGRAQTPPPPAFPTCNASLSYDTTSSVRKITITYNGATCVGNYTRTGTVTVSIPAGVRWKDQGAVLTVTYNNLKITRVFDNKSITINGSHTITNVSGGLLVNLPTMQSITHAIASAGMSITFDDNTQRTWQVARRRVFTLNNGVLTLSITGDHTDGTRTGIAEWGTNRNGHAFTTSITSPLVISSACNFRLVSGEVKHEGIATVTATFGLDMNGNPTSCPGSGSYYYKLTWTGPNGNSLSYIHRY